jgi:phospholipase C
MHGRIQGGWLEGRESLAPPGVRALGRGLGEHSSFVKFIERNWQLNGTLSVRSRDNLPNPVQDDDNAYVPRNMPAIGDLFDLFHFGHDDGGG